MHLTSLAGALMEKLAALSADEEAIVLANITDEDRAATRKVLVQVSINLEEASKGLEAER